MENREKLVKDIFQKGRGILNPIFERNGFKYFNKSSGNSSGGHFISGEYRKVDREIEFSYRGSLGLVIYRLGDLSLDHETYMTFLGVKDRSKYPGFPKNPIDSFNDLAYDLENFSGDFLKGSGQEFVKFAKQFLKNPEIFKGVP